MPDPSDPKPEPAETGGGGNAAAVWYTATPGGQREGPFSLPEMKQQIAQGTLAPENLVWKDGMANWISARSLPELFAAAPPPLPSPAAKRIELGSFLETLDKLFSKPALFRQVGRMCAALAAVLLLYSIVASFVPNIRAFFAEAFVLLLAFFVGEAAGAVLDALGRIEASSTAEAKSEGDGNAEEP